MDVAKFPGLIQRGEVWWYRKVIPAEYRKVLGRTEIWESLGTKDKEEAQSRYFGVAKRVNDRIREAKTGQLPVRQDWELRVLAEQFIEWEWPRDRREFTKKFEATHDFVNERVPEWAEDKLISPLQNDDDLKRRLLEFIDVKKTGITERDADFRRLFDEAQAQYLTIYPPRPQYEFNAPSQLAPAAPSAPTAPVAVPTGHDVTIGVLFKKWLAERKPPEKTRSDWTMAIKRFKEVAACDIAVRAITKADARDFKGALLKLPRVMTQKQKTKTVPQIIAETEHLDVRRLSPGAVNKVLAAISSVIEYGVHNDYCQDNPFRGIKALTDTGRKRLPYTTEHLTTIFTSKLFAEAPGKPTGRSAGFWLPLLGLLHGTRLEELAQALASDVKHEGDVWFLDINTLGDGKKLKTAAAHRKVPIHRKATAAGFLEYVEAMRTKGERRLFPDVKSAPGRPLSAAFSKWWGRYTHRLGITDPRFTYHSLRHNFKDLCRAAGIDESVHDGLTGHSGGGVGRKYGNGVPLNVLADAMAKVKPPINLEHLHVSGAR